LHLQIQFKNVETERIVQLFLLILGFAAIDVNCPLLFNYCSGFIAGKWDQGMFIFQKVCIPYAFTTSGTVDLINWLLSNSVLMPICRYQNSTQ
jgi:hypothetical protein